MKIKYIFLLLILNFIPTYAGIGIGVESCYCYNVSFNNKLIEFELPKYNITEFKKVKKGVKKEIPEDIYKYAVFILTNNEHNLIDLKKEIDKEHEYLYKNKNDDEIRIQVALNYLYSSSKYNNIESQFLFAYLQLKQKSDIYTKQFLLNASKNNYEPAIELLAQLYLSGDQIEINGAKPFEKNEKYSFFNANIIEASYLLGKLPQNKQAQFELGKIYLSKNYNQYNQNIDFFEVKNLFENISQLDYFNEKIKQTNDYRYILNYSNLFPQINSNILTNKTIEENQAYDFINQFDFYKSLFNEEDSKFMRYDILYKTRIIAQNLYPDFEEYLYKKVTDYSYYFINEDEWLKSLSKENKLKLLKYLEAIDDANRYISKFKNPKYITETNEILVSIYNDSRLFYNGFYSIDAYRNYLINFPQSPYYYEFENKISNLTRNEKLENEKNRIEKVRIENEKQRKLEIFKPQIDAYNNLAQNYAYSYMKELSPNTGKNASFYFDSNDFDSNERKVILKWEAKFVSSGISEYVGNLAGLSNPYELYELYGTINISEGSFNLNSQNSRVSTLKEFNSILRVSKEFAIYAMKKIVYAVNYVNSNSSNSYDGSSSSNNEKSLKDAQKLKQEIEEITESLVLVEIKPDAFWDSCPCNVYKEKAGWLGHPDWYIFKDKNGKWYYHGSLAFFDSESFDSLEELIMKKLK